MSIGYGAGSPVPTPAAYSPRVAPPPRSTPFRLERLPRSAREVITFVAAAAILVDIVLLTIAIVGSGPETGGPIAVWKMAKAVALIVMLLGIAISLRSVRLGIAAVLLSVFFFEESGLAGYRFGSALTRWLDLEPLRGFIPVSAESWGSFLVLGALAILVTLVLTATGLSHSPLMRRACLRLTTLLGLLLAFAGVWALFAEASNVVVLSTVAEFGTLLVLSLMVALAAGVFKVVFRWSATF
jgi:hypothetical protein